MLKRHFGFAIAALVLLADQLTKALMIGPLALQARGQIVLLPFFNLTWTENRGISLGMLTADGAKGRWLLVALTAAIAVFITVWMVREPKSGERLALGMVLGGALGNILDRSRFGYVVDFADLHFGAFRPFLVFNVADAGISIGVVILLLRAFLIRPKAPEESFDHV